MIDRLLATWADLEPCEHDKDGFALRELRIARRDQEQHGEARQVLTESARIFAELGDQLWQARALASLQPLDQPSEHGLPGCFSQASALCHREGITDAGKASWILSEW